MASFCRADYERIVFMSRQLMALSRVPGAKNKDREMKKIAEEMFSMAEFCIGQQTPPLEPEIGYR